MLGRLARLRTHCVEKKRTRSLVRARFRSKVPSVTSIDKAHATAPPARERAVQTIGRALAVVPSLGLARAAWSGLGFSCGPDFVFQGCRAFDIQLAESGIRILRPDRDLSRSVLGDAAARMLKQGAGLIGWTWACRDPERTRRIVESATNEPFETSPGGGRSFVVPRALTAGAVTLLEPYLTLPAPAHPNGADHIDHLVLMVGDADATAETIGRAFHLNPKVRDLKKSRYAFCKVGATVLEIVGPPEPDSSATEGKVWGITFGVAHIDRAIAEIRARGIDMPDAHDAIQGGRIVSVPMPVGGIQVAFMEA